MEASYAELIVDNMECPVLLFDSSDRLAYAGKSWFRYCGSVKQEEIAGKNICDIVSAFVTEEALADVSRCYFDAVNSLRTTAHTIEMDFEKLGENPQIIFQVQYAPLFGSGSSPDGMMAFFYDVTAIEKDRREAERAREHAEYSSRAKSTFLAKMSHEIRTPMNAVIGMAELALREENAPNTHEHLLTIKQASTNLLSIINDILDFSKIEKGKLEIVPSEYLFSSLINDVINIIKMRVFESRLRFIVNLDCDIPDKLVGDSTRIRQIMLNLLSNAVNYTDRGHIAVSVKMVKSDDNAVLLAIEVADSGRGIKEEDLPMLFEEFVQFDKETIGIYGTGLGLTITKNLLLAMDGHIKCASEFGKGSTFTAVIPQTHNGGQSIAAVTDPDSKKVLIFERRELCINSIMETMMNLGVRHRVVSSEEEFVFELQSDEYMFVFVSSVLFDRMKRKNPDFKTKAKIVLIAEFGELIGEREVSVLTTPIFCLPVANLLNGITDGYTGQINTAKTSELTAPNAKALVVDDIITNLKVAEGLLQSYKINVDLCKSGKAAIEEVKKTRYDIIFMDHMMPEMDGVEATSHIRKLGACDPYFAAVPIIALTANAVSGTRELFINNGFNDFLSKPIDVLRLRDIIEKWVPKDKQRTSLPGGSARSSGVAKRAIKIEGLDVSKGIFMTGGTAETYIDMLSTFVKDGTEKLDEIKESIRLKNYSLYSTYVHGLKSACGIIGADKLAEDSQALEAAGSKGDIVFVESRNPALIADLERLINNINAANLFDNDPINAAGLDVARFTETLRGLREALDSFDSADINMRINILREYSRTENYGKTVESIIGNKMIGDYDAAIAKITELLEKLGAAD